MNIQMYFTGNTISELVCFLAAIFFLWKDKAPAWKLLIVFLALTCITEMGGIYLRRVIHMHNSWLYNIFILAECSINTYFFYNLFCTLKYAKKILWGWIALFISIYLVELFYNHFNMFVANTATVMAIVFTLASVYYYYMLLISSADVNLKTHAPFWWVNGTIFFYFGSTATNLFFDYLIYYRAPDFSRSVYYILLTILNILLYCCWVYAFFCRWLQRKSFTS